MDDSVGIANKVNCTEDSLVDSPIIHNQTTFPLHSVLCERFRGKRRARPLAITTNKLSRDYFCLQLLINPLGLFPFEAVWRRTTRRACRYRAVKQLPQRHSRCLFYPESSGLPAEHLSAGFHISLGQTWSGFTLPKS